MKVAAEPVAEAAVPTGLGRGRNSFLCAPRLLTQRGEVLPTHTLQTFGAAHAGTDFIANGVDLFILQDLLRLAKAYCYSSGKALESFRIHDLVEHVIKPLTAPSKCAYVELLLGSISSSAARSSFVASRNSLFSSRYNCLGLGAHSLANKCSKCVSNKADVYVIFAYDFYLVDLINALEQHKKRSSEEVSFWLEFLSTNFWDARGVAFGAGKQALPTDARPAEPAGRFKVPLSGPKKSETAASGPATHFAQANSYTIPRSTEWYVRDLPAFMRHVGHVLVLLLPWSAPLVLRRSWCLVEMLAAYTSHPCSGNTGLLRFTVGFSARRHEEFVKVLCDDFERGLGILVDNAAIDIENSLCDNYVSRAEHMVACCAMVSTHGFAEANACVARLLSAWAVGVSETHHSEQLAQQRQELELLRSQRLSGARRLCHWGECRQEEASLRLRECQSMYVLCNLRVLAKDFAQAEAGFGDVLERLNACGRGDESDPMVLGMRGSLALVYQGQGRLDEALAVAEPLLLLKRRLHGELHPSTITTMHNTALLLLERGGERAAEGLQLYLDVVAAKSTALGPHHAETLQASAHLCSLYHELGRHDECALALKEALRVRSEVLGPSAASLLPLYDLLIGLRQQAAHPRPPEHPLWFELHHSRPRAPAGEQEEDAFRELLGYHEEALAVHEQAFGRDSLVTLAFAKRFSRFLVESGRFDMCIGHFQQVYETECALLGREHHSTAESLDALVSLLCRGGRHSDALPLAVEAVALRQRIFDDKCSNENNKRLIDAMFVVGSLHTSLRRHGEAVEHYRCVLALQRAAYGPAAKQTLVTHYYLACDEAHMQEYEAAFEHFQIALDGFDALFAAGAEGFEEGDEEGKSGVAADNYWSASCAMSLARLCRSVGNYTQSEKLARRALHYYTQLHGSQHELAVEAVAFVNALYSHHKKAL